MTADLTQTIKALLESVNEFDGFLINRDRARQIRIGAIQLVGVELGLLIAEHTTLHHGYSLQLSGAATL